MPRRFSSNEVVRALSRIGILPVRQRGSHIQLRGFYEGARRAVTVPANQRVLEPRDLGSILRQAGLTLAQLEELVDR